MCLLHQLILLYQKIFELEQLEEVEQIAFNDSPNMDVRDFINLYKNRPAKPNCFLGIDTSLPQIIPCG